MVYRTPPENFNPKLLVVGCFVEHDGKILLLQRHEKQSLGNQWGIPGGKMNEGEDISTAMLRELQEETGIVVEKDRLEYFAPFYVRNGDFEIIYHQHVLKLSLRPDITLSDWDHQDYTWVTPAEALIFNYVHDVDSCIYEVYGITLPVVEKGIYCHYKGNEYEVLGMGKHTETHEDMVIYKALYGAGIIWSRPVDSFFEEVEYKGNKVPRFVKL